MTVAAIGIWIGGGVLGILVVIAWIAGLIDVFRRPDLDRRQRIAWVLLIVLLPLAGTIVYFIVRPTLPEERERIIAAHTTGRK
jgi:phospholipase D-like protein